MNCSLSNKRPPFWKEKKKKTKKTTTGFPPITTNPLWSYFLLPRYENQNFIPYFHLDVFIIIPEITGYNFKYYLIGNWVKELTQRMQDSRLGSNFCLKREQMNVYTPIFIKLKVNIYFLHAVIIKLNFFLSLLTRAKNFIQFVLRFCTYL